MAQFTTEKSAIHLLIKTPPLLDAEAAEQFSALAKNWLLTPVDLFVLDASAVTKITKEFYAAAIKFKTRLAKDQKKFFTVHLNHELGRTLISDGVSPSFHPVASLEEVFRAAGLATKKTKPASPTHGAVLDVSVLNPFLKATLTTFEVQVHTKLTAGKPFLKNGESSNLAIVGVLTLDSEKLNGKISLCFSQKVFLEIYNKMFSETHAEITDEIQDAAAELLNMIYGQAKVELNKVGHTFQRAFPSVITGVNLRERARETCPVMVIPFTSAIGDFNVEIAFSNHAEAA